VVFTPPTLLSRQMTVYHFREARTRFFYEVLTVLEMVQVELRFYVHKIANATPLEPAGERRQPGARKTRHGKKAQS
jgi:hypothetical protein